MLMMPATAAAMMMIMKMSIHIISNNGINCIRIFLVIIQRKITLTIHDGFRVLLLLFQALLQVTIFHFQLLYSLHQAGVRRTLYSNKKKQNNFFNKHNSTQCLLGQLLQHKLFLALVLLLAIAAVP